MKDIKSLCIFLNYLVGFISSNKNNLFLVLSLYKFNLLTSNREFGWVIAETFPIYVIENQLHSRSDAPGLPGITFWSLGIFLDKRLYFSFDELGFGYVYIYIHITRSYTKFNHIFSIICFVYFHPIFVSVLYIGVYFNEVLSVIICFYYPLKTDRIRGHQFIYEAYFVILVS